jgi:hypothetical protein
MPTFTISSQPTNLTIDQPSPSIKLYTNGAITFGDSGGGGTTNLSYTPSPTQGQVNSSTGTDATIPATDGINAGLFLPSEKTRLASQVVPYTGATSDVDLGNFNLNTKGVKINGTAGTGHLGLKHQSSNATAGGQETALFAGSTGELFYKNDGNIVEQIPSKTYVDTGLAGKQNTITNSDSITQGTTNLFLTTTERTKLTNTTNTNTGDETTGSILNKIGNGTVIDDNYIPNSVARGTEILTKTLDTTFVPTNSAIVLGNTVLQSLEKAQGQINNKENTITAGTTSQYFRGDKTFQTLDKTAVGLANVDNTSDLNKPISTATQTALNFKQNTLVSGTNIKTINGQSLLSAGDLVVAGINNEQSIINALIFG